MTTESTTTKKTTTRKTTTKPKTEAKSDPTIDVNSLQQQMQQMMQLMAQQQQVIASLTQNNPEVDDTKPLSKEKQKLTKQYLRRTYKDVEIYLQKTSSGITSFKGRDGIDVVWEGFGDVQPVTIEDILAMDDKFLQVPWLVIDEEDNDEELISDLTEVLKLENPTLRYKTLTKLEEDINEVDIDEIKQMLAKSKDGSLILDVCACVQQKIKSGELESYKRIEQFEKLVGRKFEM